MPHDCASPFAVLAVGDHSASRVATAALLDAVRPRVIETGGGETSLLGARR